MSYMNAPSLARSLCGMQNVADFPRHKSWQSMSGSGRWRFPSFLAYAEIQRWAKKVLPALQDRPSFIRGNLDPSEEYPNCFRMRKRRRGGSNRQRGKEISFSLFPLLSNDKVEKLCQHNPSQSVLIENFPLVPIKFSSCGNSSRIQK